VFWQLNQLGGRGYKTRLLNPVDEFWDRWLGVRTFGYYPGGGEQEGGDWRLHYEPTPYRDLFHLLRKVGLGSSDVFVDLGAGMGRAVFTASRLGARRSIGIEVVAELCEKARRNQQQSWLAQHDIEFIRDHASNYHHDGTTVLFMFHPFGEDVLRRVLRNLESNVLQNPARVLRIIYLNPVFDEVLHGAGWLHFAGQVPACQTVCRYSASIWRSR